MTIDSKKEFLHNKMRFIIKRYRSLSIMTSLFWRCDITSFGVENPGKTFYVIKDSLGISGLGDMIMRALMKIAMVKEKPGNIIPVVDFSVKNDINQFTEGNGENAWTLYFEQICEESIEEVYKSKNVIISTHSGWDWYNPYTYEKQCFMDWKKMFHEYLKIKKDVKKFIEELYNKTIQNREERILGVIGRGTDWNSSRGGVPKPMDPEIFFREVERVVIEWKCDSIFLATEDQKIYNMFMESKLSDKIYCVDQYRIDYSDKKNYDLLLSEIKIREHKTGYFENLNYLGIIYILSKCDSLVSTCDCGAARCAMALKSENYRNVSIF